MKRLLLVGLLLTTTAHAKIEGTVAVNAKQVNGNQGWQTELVCEHSGTTHNTSDKVETAHIRYSLCDLNTGKCSNRVFTWKLQPGQQWDHSWTTTMWVTYKYSGHYEYTCSTEVVEIGEADKTGWVEIH